jgi:hypothetical protein
MSLDVCAFVFLFWGFHLVFSRTHGEAERAGRRGGEGRLPPSHSVQLCWGMGINFGSGKEEAQDEEFFFFFLETRARRRDEKRGTGRDEKLSWRRCSLGWT